MGRMVLVYGAFCGHRIAPDLQLTCDLRSGRYRGLIQVVVLFESRFAHLAGLLVERPLAMYEDRQGKQSEIL